MSTTGSPSTGPKPKRAPKTDAGPGAGLDKNRGGTPDTTKAKKARLDEDYFPGSIDDIDDIDNVDAAEWEVVEAEAAAAAASTAMNKKAAVTVTATANAKTDVKARAASNTANIAKTTNYTTLPYPYWTYEYDYDDYGHPYLLYGDEEMHESDEEQSDVQEVDDVYEEDPTFRYILEDNHIQMHPTAEPLPRHVQTLVDRVLNTRGKASQAGPTKNELRIYNYGPKDPLEEMFQGVQSSATASNYFIERLAPLVDKDRGSGDVLTYIRNLQPMNGHAAPWAGGAADKPRPLQPRPDLLYGYAPREAFSPEAQLFLDKNKDDFHAFRFTEDPPVFPFLVANFLGFRDNFLVAGNKCLSASAVCVRMNETLQDRLWQVGASVAPGEEVAEVESRVFSIAMSGNEVRLYVTWTEEIFVDDTGNEVKIGDDTDKKEADYDAKDKYYMADIECFLLRRPDDLLHFRRVVCNILDWGRGDRFQDYYYALKAVVKYDSAEEAKKEAKKAKEKEKGKEQETKQETKQQA